MYPQGLLPLKAKSCCKIDPELKIYNQQIMAEKSCSELEAAAIWEEEYNQSF